MNLLQGMDFSGIGDDPPPTSWDVGINDTPLPLWQQVGAPASYFAEIVSQHRSVAPYNEEMDRTAPDVAIKADNVARVYSGSRLFYNDEDHKNYDIKAGYHNSVVGYNPNSNTSSPLDLVRGEEIRYNQEKIGNQAIQPSTIDSAWKSGYDFVFGSKSNTATPGSVPQRSLSLPDSLKIGAASAAATITGAAASIMPALSSVFTPIAAALSSAFVPAAAASGLYAGGNRIQAVQGNAGPAAKPCLTCGTGVQPSGPSPTGSSGSSGKSTPGGVPGVRSALPSSPGSPGGFASTLNAITNSVMSVFGAIAQSKQAGRAQQGQNPYGASAQSGGGMESASSSTNTYLLIGGGVLAAGLLVYVVAKK